MTLKNKSKKCNAEMLLVVNFLLMASKTTQNAHYIKTQQCYKQALVQIRRFYIGLSIANVKKRPI